MAEDRRRILREAAELLEESGTVRDQGVRLMLLRELELAIGVPLRIREVGLLRPQLVELVAVCVAHTGGLRSLADCLDLLEPDAARVHALLRLADEWQVFEQFAGRDLRWLRDHLVALRSTVDLRGLVAEQRIEPVPVYCESAWHVFAYLALVPARDGTPSWLRFLEQLVPVVPAAAQARLRDLIQALAEEWGVLERAGSDPTPAVVSASATGDTAYLTFQFEKYGADDDTFIMSYWYQWASPVWHPVRGEDQHVRRGDLEAAVDRVVVEAERRWADQVGPVAIEFVLPWQLLNEPVERWRTELDTRSPRPLAIRYPLVIRSLERIRADHWHRVWRGRWKVVVDRTVLRGLVHCAVGDQSDVQLEATLEHDGTAVVLVLSEPPLPDSAGEGQLLMGVRSGMPAIVWDRHASSRQGELCEVVTSMVNASLDTLQGVARLPQRVAELRRTAWREDPRALGGQIGHGLVILWDDPDRQPGRTGSAGIDTGKVRA